MRSSVCIYANKPPIGKPMLCCTAFAGNKLRCKAQLFCLSNQLDMPGAGGALTLQQWCCLYIGPSCPRGAVHGHMAVGFYFLLVLLFCALLYLLFEDGHSDSELAAHEFYFLSPKVPNRKHLDLSTPMVKSSPGADMEWPFS